MKKLIDIPEGTDVVELRKKINKILSESRNLAKPGKCILCGKEQTSFCNSHSVPQLVLRNIADNGKVLHASALLGIDVVDIEKGVKNSGTFFYICNSCDGLFFKDYEDEQNLKLKISDKMLAEIAVKDFLLLLSKRTQEEELHKLLQRQFNAYSNPEDLAGITGLDVRDFNEELQFHKEIADNNLNGGYQILFSKLLPYKVPIALQSAIALPEDLEGNEINNIFDMSESVRMQFMHLAIFPLQEESVILAYYHKRDKLYRKLRHQINGTSEQRTLQFLNYIIFTYTENYFISKTIKEIVESDEKLSLLGQENNGNPNLGFLGPDNYFGLSYQPVKMDEIPNFLSSQWALTPEKMI
ncbi:MAG: hypothetical protein PHY47_12420 [Lachnospiraceae bacterium]|nr:hypothetical protein [Lachnospiraceae bacterium]